MNKIIRRGLPQVKRLWIDAKRYSSGVTTSRKKSTMVGGKIMGVMALISWLSRAPGRKQESPRRPGLFDGRDIGQNALARTGSAPTHSSASVFDTTELINLTLFRFV
jgi:hypothetical protein